MMHRLFVALLLTCALAGSASASPVVHYRVNVGANALDRLRVAMTFAVAPAARFVIAAHAHPEYDDKYWRYIENMRADGGTVTRLDSVRWQVATNGKSVTVTYDVRLPAARAPRAAWRAYLTANGGLIGGPHTFLYPVGSENMDARVILDLPAGWNAATSLTRAADGAFAAPDMFALMESPMMVGRMSERAFDVAGKRHRVFYLAGVHPVPFDTAALVSGIRGLVEQTVQLFGSTPYDEYTFLIADDAYGGLEHPSSVTIGARSSELAADPLALMPEFAHEFFHTWNLMSIRPAEYRGVDYRVQPPVPTLWFSEGYSIFYADLLLRRAGVKPEDTRMEHLQDLITRYLDDPAYRRFSPETISRHEYNSVPGALGNHDPSTHTIGEALANAIDLKLRAETRGKRGNDDFMRAMNVAHGARAFGARDLERVATDVCGCDMAPFFRRHVYASQAIDWAALLAPFGMMLTITRDSARTHSGEIERDFRIRAWQPAPADTLRLHVWHGESIWARSGLNMNDRVLAINGTPVRTWPEFRNHISSAPMGGTLRFSLVRDGKPLEVTVTMAGYERTRARVTSAAAPNALRAAWVAGN